MTVFRRHNQYHLMKDRYCVAPSQVPVGTSYPPHLVQGQSPALASKEETKPKEKNV